MVEFSISSVIPNSLIKYYFLFLALLNSKRGIISKELIPTMKKNKSVPNFPLLIA
jgi:hypothetical protein